MNDWVSNAQGWYDTFIQIFDYKIVQVIVAVLLVFIGVRFIRRSIRSFFDRTSFIEERKEKTLESMINSIVSYTATIGIIIYVLSVYGVPVGSMLAGAGVIGIILGFGAQSLIRDILSGIFFIYEKQLHKGDFVSINDKFIGTVEDIGLRFLKIRQWSGKLLTISNGQVSSIQNYNIDHMRVIEAITVSFTEDPKRVFSLLEETCEQLNEELGQYLKKDLTDKPIQPFQVYGMTSLNKDHRGYEYTIVGLTEDLVYWTAAKEARRMIAERLFDAGIQMSLQHIDIPSPPSTEQNQ
ncbi:MULTISPECIES: mechanosensitive ion channel family protein [Pontibacillus]|uniref:Mechanosensitive ion channel family protein n=1 Tax=Pontibacillus chungwhensis TaxID=265426 RepID=A0ABY8V050_9BACI|nr:MULTISPECIES: mechanosensitive ion channel family protein [Pontibacillus]MCD5325479.1 mechanosensitive ion channel family protein [Pontibacillus sp. HN14]WIF98592.1 mechanosensitive ion channel family protein [Pontibacillus chungwhensis]